ncbi:MAG: S8 family serine peptidase [Bacteroidetes bacterium]|nr:S8 family serine peptidase [Bacteroidota bacterium]
MKTRIKLVVTTLILFINFSLHAQSNYYYYKGQKVYLQLEKKYLTVNVKASFQTSTLNGLNIISSDLSVLSCIPGEEPQRILNLEFQTIPDDIEFLEKINSLKNNPDITNIAYHFKNTPSKSMSTSNIFYVKLKKYSDVELLQNKALEKNVKIEGENKFMPLWYRLSCNITNNSIESSNYFYETGLFADVDPGFLFDFKSNLVEEPCSNDSQLNEMWGYQNSANPNIDINMCQAWNITEGNGIKVAIMDSGVDKTHIDLSANIDPSSFDTCFGNGSSPSQLYWDHATGVAGIIAAVKNNETMIAGVAPQSKILDISNKFLTQYAQFPEQLANGINWAWMNGADVINNSYGDQGGNYYNYYHSAILENAFENAITQGRGGLGCVVTFSSGNWTNVDYPANSNPDFLVVGGINSTGERSVYSSNVNSSAFGQTLDVVAPGSNVLTLANGDETINDYGTSISAPHVSGIAALILSVNPCLSQKQVVKIIEKTSQKVGNYNYIQTDQRPNGTWNNEMGYGLVDAYAAVQLAQQMYSATLDLMVKDGTDDFGLEPNNSTPIMWASTDIWVRNTDDNIEEHENPFYNAMIPNFAYIRITNKSCVPSSGNEQLKFYWAKAGTSLEWPDTWDGQHYFPAPNNSSLLGAPVTPNPSTTIPVIQPGQEKIIKVPFLVPNPNDYTFAGEDKWHFCLLAKIESAEDPTQETNNLYSFVQNNNNLAWKNVTVVDVADVTAENPNANIGGIVAVGNPFDEPKTFYLEMIKEDLETGKNIYDEAEVSIKMDNVLYQAWKRGGEEAQKLDATSDEKRKIVKGNNVILDNLSFLPNEMGTLNVKFNFLTKELTEKSKFIYHVIQKDAVTGSVIGGETYVIKKKSRPIFTADAGGDKEVDQNEIITISAQQINEAALYNWYDMSGNLIFQGKDLTVSADIVKKYKLEVIATKDGFKDYTQVEVKFKPSSLQSIAPNPASNLINVQYKLNDVSSAYLMIVGSYGTVGNSNNYILDINSSETTLDISAYQNGFYTLALVCNGQIIDAKTLIKN